MLRLLARLAFVAIPVVAAAQKPAPAPAPAVSDSSFFAAFQWRSIGPFRGGRANAIAGVPSQPMVFYTGYTGGGVWKTDDAGLTWKNISDGQFRLGSIGAIAVAESDPNVVYVGTGEHAVRGQSSSFGNGVYRSTDAGKTWKHLGLDATQQVSAVRVHPTNPDVVWVAAQGNRWTGTHERGIYRSMDGGKTWSPVLKGENGTSGASGLSLDASNPRILYAAFWDHQRTPWKVRSGGPGSGIWKSTDAGDTWVRLAEGLPKLMGKVDVAVSPANPDRVFAIVEAEDGGLYRSDDAGRSWRRFSDDRLIRARAWYYTNIVADPQNADVVWVINAPLTRSIDGGKTFAVVNATHGDNHGLWINPRDPKILANANDGGASISMNGGKSWSTQDNQPTAQFYRVNVDDLEPYNVYGGQQDNSSVRTQSRSDGFGITVREWTAVAGCESAYLAFNRARPRHVYGGCYQGIISEYDAESGFERNVMVWPALGLGEPSDLQKYRFNWNAPIVVSSHDPSVIYHAANVLFRSRDRGKNWEVISGDLTRNDKATQGPGGGPITNEGAGGEVYNTIYYVAESPRDPSVLWAGTDDGLLHLTRDGGKSWTNLTGAAGWGPGLVNAIEASPHDPAVAYVAFRKDRLGENAVLAYRTADYGRTWTLITNGLRAGEPVRVVRESPDARGVLFAGTESGTYVSFDDGARWTPFSQNLPQVPVTDLIARHGDLVASTEGRSFWILDHVAASASSRGVRPAGDVALLSARSALLGRWVNSPADGVGRNPPNGATLTFFLKAAPDTTTVVTLDVKDAQGRLLRSYSSKPATGKPALPAKAGTNRFTWDLREETPTRAAGLLGPGQQRGRRVQAGRYIATLTWKGSATSSSTVSFDVRRDARAEPMADADVARVSALLGLLTAALDDLNSTVNELRDARDQVARAAERSKETPNKSAIDSAAVSIKGSVDALESELVQPRSKTFQDVINFRNGLSEQIINLQEALEESDAPVTDGMEGRREELDAQWREKRAKADRILDVDIGAFNKLLKDQPQVQVQRKKKTIS